MMKQLSKRLLSLLLCAIFAAGLSPFAALAEEALPDCGGDWLYFRGNPENNGVTDAATPASPETATLKWANKYGNGWSAAPTPPLILNDRLYIAMSDRVVVIDRDTGEELMRSEAMAGTVGFAMNPIAYGGGRIYVPLSGGRIQALRADTLELLWVSGKWDGLAQTVSPVIYRDGHVYTGIWNGEEKNGFYFCVDAQTGEPVWNVEQMGGFYWAGAYVSGEYLIVGSGDSAPENSYTETAVLLSLDPKTGDVIDTLENIKGDIRSSVCYDNGKVYFATKGGWFCVVEVNSDGTFDDSTFQYVDLKGMCTGTPMVYNDRAYIGSSGAAQFTGPGYLNVVDLSGETPALAYRAELPGYPQASALSTNAYGDTAYVYITYNQRPGGIYAIQDRPGQTDAVGYDLYTPEKEQQNYGICSLVCDREGTLYYKNDSCYLMAVANNTAYLTALTADTGAFGQAFTAGGLSYELAVPRGTGQVTLTPTPCEGGSVTINGAAPAPILLTEGRATASIVVTHETNARTYTVHIRETSDNALLSGLAVNESNSFGGDKVLTPAFTADETVYACFGVGSGRSFVNLWPTAADPNAAVAVYAVSNVDPEDIRLDGTLEITASPGGHDRYALYFEDAAKPMTVRVEVLSEDETARKSYTVLVTKAAADSVSYAGALSMTPTLSLPGGGAALTAVPSAARGTGAPEVLTWTSSNPAAATVDQSGAVTYVGDGVTTITAAGALASASCVVTCGSPSVPDDTISVSFRLIGSTLSTGDVDLGTGSYAGASYQTWLKTASYQLPKGATVYDLFTQALGGAGISYTGADRNYVDSICAPSVLGGYQLSEFTNGPRSGWMYTINGSHPGFGLKERKLHDGDKVIWHYVNDYSYEVKDWFDDGGFPSLGDGTYYNLWLKAADTNPTASGGTDAGGTDGDTAALKPAAPVDKNGVAKAQVTAKDMEKAIASAKKDGATSVVIEPDVKGDASKVSVELPREAVAAIAKDTTARLTVKTAIAHVSLPTAALSELGQTAGKTVVISAEAVRDENGKANDEINVQVTTDGKTVDSLKGGLIAALPVTRPTPGTVLMLLTDEGAKIIKKSAVDGTTLSGLLPGSATVVVKDNTRTFADVGEDYWGQDAINFAASHDLFQGTGPNSFAPAEEMSRAMLFTVLARMEGQDTTTGSAWYELPMLWAKEQGISDGTNPHGSITREQLATMLYRYAKTVGVDVSADGNAMKAFDDADKVSDWADDAMAWAVRLGLISGKGSGCLDPAGTASRGEVAAMLQRFIPLLLK